MSDFCYYTSVAAYSNIVRFHLYVEAASHRLTQVTSRVLSCPTQLLCRIKGAPCRVEIHNRNIDDSHEGKHEQEGSDEAKVRDNAETKTSHGIFAWFEIEVELRLIGVRLPVTTEVHIYISHAGGW